MKTGVFKKITAGLLTLLMVFSLLPATALAKEDRRSEPMPYDSTDDVYMFNEKEYKVLSNGYISCYVSMEDGGFTVLPAASEFDPDKPASHASFRIDGQDWRYGMQDPLSGTVLISPTVEDGVMETQWKVGDYVISQIHAIQQEASRPNAWAVSVGYVAEYFGTGESSISARVLLDTTLGEQDDLPLLTGNNDEPQLYEALISPVPESMYVSEGEYNNAFLLYNEPAGVSDFQSFPSAAALADFGAMANADFDVEVDTTQAMANNDSGVAVYYGSSVLTEPAPEDETVGAAMAMMKVSYGFTDLQFVQAPALNMDLFDAAAGEAAEVGWELDTDLLTAPNLPVQGTVGEPVAFRLDLKYPDLMEIGAVELNYFTEEEGNLDVPVVPDEDGLYSFTMPQTSFVYVHVELNMPDCAILEIHNESPFLPSITADYLLGASKAVVPHGEHVTLTVGGVSEGAAPGVFLNIDYGPTNEPVSSSKISDGQLGEIHEFTITAPVGSRRLDASVLQAYEYSISTRVFPQGKNVFLNVDAHYVNGQLCANAGEEIEIFADDVDGNLSALAQIVVYTYSGGTATVYKTIPYDDFGDTSEMKFTMPAGNVEVRLEITQLHNVDFEMPITGGPADALGEDAREWGYGNITVLPALPELGQSVQFYINLYEGAVLDGDPTVSSTDGPVTITPVQGGEATHAYSFTAPGGASQTLTIRASIQIPDEPVKQYSVYTRPLTNAGKMIAEMALSAEISVAGGGIQTVPVQYTGQAPEGAVVRCDPVWSIPQGDRDFYTHNGELIVTAMTDNGAKVSLLRKGATPADYHYEFIMPGEPVTVTAASWSHSRRYFELEAKHNVIAGVPGSGTATPDTQTTWYVNGDPYVPGYSAYGDKTFERAPKPTAGDFVIVGFRQNRGAFFAYQLADLIITDAGTGEVIDGADIGLHHEGYTSLGTVANLRETELRKFETVMATWLNRPGMAPQLLTPRNAILGEVYELYSFTMPNRDIKITQTYKQIDAAVTMQVIPNSSGQQLPANLKITNDSGSLSTRGDRWDVRPQFPVTFGSGTIDPTVSTEFVLSFEGSDRAYEISGVSYHHPSNPNTSWNISDALQVVWRTANAIKYKFSYPVAATSVRASDMPVFSFRLVDGARFTGMRLYTSSYVSEAQNFKEISLQGINAANFNANDLISLTYDGTLVDFNRLTVKSETELTLNMEGIVNANDVGVHFLKMSWNVIENGQPSTAEYSTQVKLHGPIPPTPPGTAKYLGIAFDPAVKRYELIDAPSQALMASKAGGKQIILSMSCDAGFSSQALGNETKWTANPVDGKNSPVLFSSGLSTRPSSAGLGSGVAEYFSVSSFYQAPDGDAGVKIDASAYGLYAGYLPVYVPSAFSYKYVMELENGEEYLTDMPTYLQEPDTSKAPQFELKHGDGPIGPCMGIDILGYGGFRAEYSGIKYLKSGIDLSGELSVQLPEILADGAMAGITIENMILNFSNEDMGFEGVRASGEFTMPPFLMLGAVDGNQGLQAKIDTFKHQYEFEVELDAKVVQIEGKLKLGVSERLSALNNGGAIIVPDEFYFDVTSGYGIPIIPGTEVANINGAKGGFSGLIKTIDFNIDKQTIPPFDVTAGGTFKLLQLIEFDGKFTIGAAKIRTDLSMSIDLGGLNVPIFKKYEFEVGMRDAQPQKYSLNSSLVNPKRVEIYYYSKIAVELIPGFKIIEGSGSWEAALGMTSPDAWTALAINGQFNSFADYVNALNLKLSIYGELAGSILVPDSVPLIGGKALMNGTASMYGQASFQNGVDLDALRAYAYAEFGAAFAHIGFYALYDFVGGGLDWGQGAGPGSARLFSSGGNALYSEHFDGGNGKVTFGNGLVLCADSSGAGFMPMTFAASAGATPSIYVSLDGMTHTVTMPDNGVYLILTDAPKDKLFVYDSNGDSFPLNVLPDVVTTEQAALAYNAIETKDGKLLIGLGGVPGDWTLTSSEPFQTVVYKSTIKPANVSNVKIGAGFDEVVFDLDGLVDGESYYYDIILQKKSSADGQVESSFIIADKAAFTASGTTHAAAYPYDLTQLADSAPTGAYFPKIMLYKVTTASTLGYEPVAAGHGYTPYENTNTKYDNATLGLLADLNAAPGGNATLHVTFTDVVPQGLTEAVSYRVAVYDAQTLLPALNPAGKEIVIELPASASLPSTNDFYISGLEPGKEYIVEATPMFTSTMTYDIGGQQKTQSITTLGNPKTTGAIIIPTPDVPVLTLSASAGTIQNGTVYAPSGATLIVGTDRACDIVVKKYVGQSVVSSVQNGTATASISLHSLAGTLLTITATDPTTGDSIVEYVNILVIDAPPPLVVDVNENGVVAASAAGAFTLYGRTAPHSTVSSTLGQSVRAGEDGSFTMTGTILEGSQSFYLTVSDAAGNSETASVKIVRGSGGSGRESATPHTAKIDSQGGSMESDSGLFTDDDGHWAEQYINALGGQEVVSGIGNGKYAPDDPLTRAQFVQILYNVWGGGDISSPATPFADAGHGAWYENALNWAYVKGLISGYSATSFGPNDPITREQMAVLIVRAADEFNIALPERNEKTVFADDEDIASWAKGAVYAMQQAGILTGKPGNQFDPQGKLTRGEMAKVIYYTLVLAAMLEDEYLLS